MATIPEDQSKVSVLANQRGWSRNEGSKAYKNAEGSSRVGARSVACFGMYLVYHITTHLRAQFTLQI